MRYPCNWCGNYTTRRLKTRNGDPEAIRFDRACRHCGAIMGMTKAGTFVLAHGKIKMRKVEVRP